MVDGRQVEGIKKSFGYDIAGVPHSCFLPEGEGTRNAKSVDNRIEPRMAPKEAPKEAQFKTLKRVQIPERGLLPIVFIAMIPVNGC